MQGRPLIRLRPPSPPARGRRALEEEASRVPRPAARREGGRRPGEGPRLAWRGRALRKQQGPQTGDRALTSPINSPAHMEALESHLDPQSADFKANAERLRGLVDELNARFAKAREGG